MITLNTRRLRLESLAPSHAPALLEYNELNRAHLEPWEPARKKIFCTLPEQYRQIEQSVRDAGLGISERFVAFEPEESQIVANVNLWNIRRGVIEAAVIGYSVDASREGQGYATELCASIVDHAFKRLNLHRLETSYQPSNERSGRVLRKLGFIVEGYVRDYLFLNGGWRDGILVGLTNSSWRPAGTYQGEDHLSDGEVITT